LKKRKIIIFLLIAFILYFVFLRDEYPIVEELPDIMQRQFDVVLNPKTNQVKLYKNGVPQSIVISIDKDKTLYIANSIGNNINKFKIDKNKNQIYIFKDEFNYHTRDNDKFQLIKVPYSKYNEIISDNALNVYIDYGPGYETRKYNLANSDYEILEYIYPTK
jgi:hypothetical protein